MRRGPEVSGWVGSLFPEAIDQVKALSDRCVCHQDCPQYETCETEALDKTSKIYYLLRCVKGKFPACANCMCMACDRYHECKDGPEMGLRGGTRYRMCHRPISITGCLDYSGSIPWRSETYCKKCDHVCDLRKKLVWAPRVRCDLNPIEPTKKPTEEPSPVQLDGKWHDIIIIDNVVKVDGVICDDNFVPLTHPAPKPAKAKKQPKVPRVPYPDNDGCDKCLCSTCLNEKVCQKCEGMNEICAAYGHPHTIGCPAYSKTEGEGGWSCSDCLCPQCANKGQSCHTCEGPVYCTKHGGKMGGCPDFRAKDGAEQSTVPVKATTQPKPEQVPAPITKNEQEMQFLRSDIAAIDRLLAELPADHVIERLGFESRKQGGEERLAVLALAVKAAKEPKPSKAKKQHKLTRADYDNNPLPGSNADTCSHCDCETCGLNQAHLNYTDKEWASCPPCGCDQCLGKPELQPTTLCGRKSSLTSDVLGNTESQLPMEQQHMVTLQRYVRQFCGDCKCLTCGRAYQNCAMDGDEPYHICSICTLEHAHHHKPYPAIIKDCEHWIDKATFPADIYAPGHGPCPKTACELRYNGEGGPCLCHSCKHGTPDCDSTCGVPGYPMETGQYACEWYAPKVATPDGPTPEFDALAAELDVQMMKKRLTAELALPEALRPKHGPKYWDVPDLVKVGDLVTRLHTRGYVYDIRKVTRVEKTDAGWQICGDRWDDFRHPRRKQVSKNEPIIQWGVTGWKVEDGKIVPLGQKVAQETFGATYDETYADERLITLTLEQVEQLVAVEEAEDVNGPTNYTRVWLKPEKAKGHKNEQGYLEDPRTRWPCLGHARFVDTSAAAVAKIPSGRRSEVCQDEPECEHCLCKACEHQKNCRLDNTLSPCSPCKTSGGAHHHKAVDCEGCTPSP